MAVDMVDRMNQKRNKYQVEEDILHSKSHVPRNINVYTGV